MQMQILVGIEREAGLINVAIPRVEHRALPIGRTAAVRNRSYLHDNLTALRVAAPIHRHGITGMSEGDPDNLTAKAGAAGGNLDHGGMIGGQPGSGR